MKLGHMLPSELESRLRQPFSPPTFAQIPAARPLFSLNLNKIQTNNNTMHNINESVNNPSGPITIRLPKNNQRCKFTGLSRSTLNSLILPTKENNFKPPVKSFSVKKRGAIRGIRLIVYASLVDYLNSLNGKEVAS